MTKTMFDSSKLIISPLIYDLLIKHMELIATYFYKFFEKFISSTRGAYNAQRELILLSPLPFSLPTPPHPPPSSLSLPCPPLRHHRSALLIISLPPCPPPHPPSPPPPALMLLLPAPRSSLLLQRGHDGGVVRSLSRGCTSAHNRR
jgi:hypothetical protein